MAYDFDDKRVEEADSRERDLNEGWTPNCLVTLTDEDDSEGRMHQSVVGPRPYGGKERFFDEQLEQADEEYPDYRSQEEEAFHFA